MKVAIVGNKDIIQKIHVLVNAEDAFFEFTDYPCSYEEVIALLDTIQNEYDGILFTGSRYHSYAARCVSAKIPWSCPVRSVNSVLCTLLRAKLAGYDISKITCDLHPTARQLTNLLCNDIGFHINMLF